MLLLANLLAVAAFAAAPQHADRPPQKRAAATQRDDGSKTSRHQANCRRAYKSYDARTDSYRDARGKRRRCTL